MDNNVRDEGVVGSNPIAPTNTSPGSRPGFAHPSAQLFTVIPDAQVVVHRKGRYRQVPLYARGKAVFAKMAADFIRLYANGATSTPDWRWDHLENAPVCTADPHGRLVMVELC